ncbi:STAS domain-containing protein [Blastococcus sp. PRF04-17]|uniref:STAS domain-containing protein n=1 Tax=Blastococcus sp. PRF04-17 TaxID=2933797 RepID=UPI001FF6A171|nr:STAS domain-containing protein [Blastococcus sp. PRF04-17]UOY02967.1 STAS domain-containing protein [Blastococcus sp. PRF04-17]
MEIRRSGERPVVAVSGELDLAGRDLLEAVLEHVRSTDPGLVLLDLRDVSFVDTHGLAPVLERDVVVVSASRAVTQVFRLLGLPLAQPWPSRCHDVRTGRSGDRPSGS